MAWPSVASAWRFTWQKKFSLEKKLDAVDHGAELDATDHGVELDAADHGAELFNPSKHKASCSI